MDKTSLGNRMKGYEAISKNYLMRRTPVIICLDGKAFHTFTRDLVKPFDKLFMTAMQRTMLYLCKNIQGCVLGYTQSDEITLVLCDYQTLETDAWFKYNVQKMTSISASMATFAFLSSYQEILNCEYAKNNITTEYWSKVLNKLANGAFFDSRVFSLQKEEVANCLIWRQQDATRNSIQSVGQFFFSQKELYKLSTKKIQDKLFTEKGVNWNNYPTPEKRGSCCIKPLTGGEWKIDNDIPIFSENREYINARINFEN
jgi:tRNA(His) 5'-end guanylyltransferase